jgi:LPS export ABC transporter protein LptC
MNFYLFGNRLYIFIISIILISIIFFIFISPKDIFSKKKTQSESILANNITYYQSDKFGDIYKINIGKAAKYKNEFVFANINLNYIKDLKINSLKSDLAKFKPKTYLNFIDNIVYYNQNKESLSTNEIYFDIISNTAFSTKYTELNSSKIQLESSGFFYDLNKNNIILDKVKANFL